MFAKAWISQALRKYKYERKIYANIIKQSKTKRQIEKDQPETKKGDQQAKEKAGQEEEREEC